MSLESAMLNHSPEQPQGKPKKAKKPATLIKSFMQKGDTPAPELEAIVQLHHRRLKEEKEKQEKKAAAEAVTKKHEAQLKAVREKTRKKSRGSEETQNGLAELQEIERERVAVEKAVYEPGEAERAGAELREIEKQRVRDEEEAEWAAKLAEAKKKIAEEEPAPAEKEEEIELTEADVEFVEEEKAAPEEAEKKVEERDIKTAIVRVPDERARKKAEAAEMAKLRGELKKAKPFEKMSARERMKLTPEELLAMAEESRPEAEKPAPPTSKRFTEQETEFFTEGEKMGKRFEKVERRPQEIMTAKPLEVEMRLDVIKDLEIPDFDFQAYEDLVRRQQTLDRQLADDTLGKLKFGWWQKVKMKWEQAGIQRKLDKIDDQFRVDDAVRAAQRGNVSPMSIRAGVKRGNKRDGEGHIPMPGAPRDQG